MLSNTMHRTTMMITTFVGELVAEHRHDKTMTSNNYPIPCRLTFENKKFNRNTLVAWPTQAELRVNLFEVCVV